MKLKLPKLLLGAIVALSTIAQGVTLSPSLFAVDPEEHQDEYWQKKEYTGGSLTVCGDVRFPVVYYISTDVSTSFEWNTNGTNVVLSGIGHIYPQILSGDLFVDFTVNLDHYDYENEIVPTRHFSVNKYITFDNVNLQFSNKSGSQKIVDIDAKLGNGTFLKAWSNNVILDLTDARFDYASIYAESCTIQSSNLVINNKLILEVDGGSVNLRGNLTLSGGGILPGPSGRMNAWALGSDWTSGAWKNYWGGVTFDSSYAYDGSSKTLTWGSIKVNGKLSVTAPTGIWFNSSIDDENKNYEGNYNYRSGFQAPTTKDALFICGSVDEASLSMLQAYSMEEHEYVDEVWGDISEGLDYKKLGGKFVAQAQLDGKIYVYYSKNGATPESTIANAERVTTDITYNPNNTKPYYIDGGTLDASKYTGDTIYNIAGVSGSLVANKDQTLVFTDSYNIGYSVSGDPNLLIQADTVLNGKSYNTTTTTIRNALLTISSETTLTAKKELILVGDSNASVTNFGTVKGNVSINNGGTFLNQGTIDGLVALAENASLTNNGAISGDVTVETGASLYGSGTYNGLTTVKSGGLLYVGNSPGYQSHKNLRLADGAILGFCVDGITPATADNNGSGTHSCLSVSGNLTLDGVVTVNVDVTGGIAAAGRTPFTLTLFKIDPDKITVNNNGTLEGKIVSGGDLLEKGASVDWDPEDGELTISGQVTEEAVKAYEQWLREQQAGEGGTGGAYANTLWASTGVLKDFAETAACQLIIGTPGQTTAWGAAIGTFIDHRDFTYNGGGYAVGVQHACTEQFRAGVALGQSFGTYKTDESYLESDQMGIMAAITAQYVLPIVTNKCSWILNGYMGYANVENESKDIYGATGEWDDKAYTIGLRASYLQQIREDFSVSAFAGLEYMYGSQDDIRLSNGALCKDGSMQTWSIPVGVTLRGYMPMGATAMLAPEMSVTYLPIVAQNTPTIHTANGSERGSNTDRNAFIITAGANYLLDANWSMGLFYNVELNSDMVNQSGNLSVRYCF